MTLSTHYTKTFFVLADVMAVHLNKDAAFYQPDILVTHRNDCPHQAACSCYLGPGGRTSRHLLCSFRIQMLYDSTTFESVVESATSRGPFLYLVLSYDNKSPGLEKHPTEVLFIFCCCQFYL